jgi:hypothetical protein
VPSSVDADEEMPCQRLPFERHPIHQATQREESHYERGVIFLMQANVAKVVDTQTIARSTFSKTVPVGLTHDMILRGHNVQVMMKSTKHARGWVWESRVVM